MVDTFELFSGFDNWKMIAADPRNCNGAYVMLQTPVGIIDLRPETVLDLSEWLIAAYVQAEKLH